VKISKSTIINSEKSGIRIGGSNLKPVIENNNFKNNLNSISTPYSSCNNIKNNHNAIIKLWGSGGNGILYKQGLNSYFKLEQEPILIYAGDSLEIKPGVIVKSFTYQDYISVYGTLMAKGIESDSIKFIGFPNENIGIQYSSHGGIIRFFPESTNSVLEYVLMDKWGDINYWGNLGAIHVNSSGVRISKSTIINSESVGIKIASQNTFPTITNNKFSNNPKDIDAFADNCGGITANINAKIYLNQSSISSNAFLPFPGSNSNYVLNGSTNVPQNYTLTIEAGCLIDFGQNANEFTVDGTLRAIGTELSPIQLVRLQTPTNNTLGGRVYLSPNSTNSFISNVLFDKLGSAAYGYPALQINTNNFSISNITVSNSPHNGINYSATGSPRITASNFYNNKTGVYVTSGSPAFDKCNIYGNTDFGINNVSNSVTDTVDARNSYWGDMTGPYHPMLNPSGAGNTVSNKVKFDNWKQQPQNGQITDIGVSTILSPITDCNLTSTADIKVRVSNYGNASVSTFLISYKINNGNTISETVSGASLLPGRTFDYTFIAKANFSAVGTYDIIAFTNLSLDSLKTNDSARVSIENLPNVAAPSSLIPANGSVGHDITIALSWSAVANATGYDLYVWKTSEPVPTIPLASGINQITYTLPYGNLTYGTQYNWKVVAKRVSCRAESVVQSFTTRLLPDLIIESITAPSSATTETDIYVSFKIKNQGTGSTETVGWQDLVYLCDQPVLYTGVDNFFVTSVSNLSALSAGQSYQTQNYSFRLPQGIQGNYYVIVKTNVSQSLIESSTTNNQSFSIPINVTLAPPPDLQVTSVITSLQNAFSEDSLTITYKVRNLGTGPTTKSDWSDYIYLSQDEVLNQNSAGILYTFYRNQALAVSTEYTTIAKTKIPARISGTYYVHVFTDRFNNIFEFNKDNNNIGTGLPINVIQKPTPDLTANSVTFTIDSVSNNQPVTIQWATANDGAITAQPSWQENIYISNDAIFSEGADPVVGSLTRNIALNSLNSISGQQSINIPPALQEGNYYFFVKTDAGNSIYENPDEINNVSTVSSVMKVVNTDLRPIIFNTPVTAQSEQSIVVQWKVKNESRGNLINNTWNDRIYLSTNNTFEGTDLLLGSVTSNQLLGKGGEYTKQISATLPVGISGSYYLIFVTDADNNVFEKLENNNVSINAINITLAPWADLQVSNIIAPAIDTVGTSINIQYNLMNNGLGNITNKSWTDKIYLSPTNNLNETNITFIGSIAQNRSLSSSQLINQAASFTIPTLAAGQYYVLIKTDISNVIFENSDENNNSSVAATTTALRVIVVEPPQPIDLSVNGGQILSSTVTAGQSINIGWTVKNNSSTSTTASTWKDAIYLSNNPILDNSDELLSTVTINNPLAAGTTYTKTATVAIPQTASGTLYILVNTDKDNQNNDIARGNNTLPLNTGIGGQTIVITIPPPADLVPKSLTAPSQGTVAQPINVSFTIKNQGTGPTPSESWVDQLYLSTDLLLNGNDILIGSFPHSGIQTSGTEYTISGQVFLPSGVSGNYALMLKTDGADNVFERNNEANNIAFTNILINSQQPSDLSISEITVPTLEQYAGSNTSISWNIKNIGINAANGYKRDVVYFSKDSLIDASDLLFGIMDKSTFLPSQAIENNSLTKLLTNISVGEYYVILKTDILNNIVEVNENNNQTIAIGKLKVRVKELPIGSLTSDTLSNNTPLYYQLTIPQNLVNETLSITLKGDSALSATNRMYLSLNKVPDANKYEYSSTIPFKANQEIIVPALSAGVYYLTSLGNHPSQTNHPVSLFAKVIPFSISSINSNKGGDTGSVTVKIEGAKFEKGMVIRLSKQSNVYTATNVYYIDQSKLYATFNLNNAPIGIYTLSLQKSNISIAQLVDGFEVISGSSGGVDGGSNLFSCSIQNIGFDDNIQLDIVHPESVRRNQLVKITVAYANNGNVDIPVQTRMILSLEKAPINFSPDFTKDLRELILEFKESDGPPDILRAGAFGYINIYSKATAPLSFIITK
jgi:subtilase family serine protease